ncbi:hypothetical protein B0H17DRAFT_1214169 [Mycena rosella]|uniref:Uncharacterized protein n=1 Tax=Mycena rosella TaxID=1033263 RepID=A0AAD7CNI5_MYCRO|nr:hypothetical protein B0H17DRAFT_1214169 [Mycena rosella]
MLSKTTVHHFSGISVALGTTAGKLFRVWYVGDSDPLNFAKGIAATLSPPFARSASSYTTPSSTGQSYPSSVGVSFAGAHPNLHGSARQPACQAAPGPMPLCVVHEGAYKYDRESLDSERLAIHNALRLLTAWLTAKNAIKRKSAPPFRMYIRTKRPEPHTSAVMNSCSVLCVWL